MKTLCHLLCGKPWVSCGGHPSGLRAAHHTRSPRTSAHSLVDLVVTIAIIAIIAMLFSMILPTGSNKTNKKRAQRIGCAANLRNIGLAFSIRAMQSTNTSLIETLTGPELATAHFQVLSNGLASPQSLRCFADKRRPAEDFASLSNTNISYFAALDARGSNPQMFLAGDRNLTNGTASSPGGTLLLTTNSIAGWTHEMHNGEGNVLLMDGSVQAVSSPTLRRLLAASGVTNRLAMP